MSNFKCLENKLRNHSSSTKETLSDEVSGVNSNFVLFNVMFDKRKPQPTKSSLD